MIWGAWAVVCVAFLVSSVELRAPRTVGLMLRALCFLVAAGAGAVALDHSGPVLAVGGSLLAAVVGTVVGSSVRRLGAARA